jgi:ribonuclease P protein subunit POP4
MITSGNILKHELIGSDVALTYATGHPTKLTGKIVYETKNTLVLSNNGLKTLSKRAIKELRIDVEDGVCFIRGPSLIGRPVDRLFR